MKNNLLRQKDRSPATTDYTGLLGGIAELLEAACRTSARAVNALMTAIAATALRKCGAAAPAERLMDVAARFPLPWSHYTRLLLCTEKGESLARYALDGLPNAMLVREYRTALPDEKRLAAEIAAARRKLENRRG